MGMSQKNFGVCDQVGHELDRKVACSNLTRGAVLCGRVLKQDAKESSLLSRKTSRRKASAQTNRDVQARGLKFRI